MSQPNAKPGTVRPDYVADFIRALAHLDRSGQGADAPDYATWDDAQSNLMSAFADAIDADLGSVKTYGGFFPQQDGSVTVTKEGDVHGWTILPDGRVVEITDPAPENKPQSRYQKRARAATIWKNDPQTAWAMADAPDNPPQQEAAPEAPATRKTRRQARRNSE